jgi:hypothetical protein
LTLFYNVKIFILLFISIINNSNNNHKKFTKNKRREKETTYQKWKWQEWQICPKKDKVLMRERIQNSLIKKGRNLLPFSFLVGRYNYYY